MQGLLGQSRRVELAGQVNAAVLGTPRPALHEVAQSAALELLCREAGLVTGQSRTDRRLREILGGRSIADILKIQ